MKIVKYCLSFLFVCLAVNMTFSQVTTLQFVGRDRTGNDYVKLNRVSVFDLDQLWHEMLYYPDTTMMLFGVVGVQENENLFFNLYQNFPNPFDGMTDFALALTETRNVNLEIIDVTGKTAVSQDYSLPAGIHLFRVTLTTPQTYLLRATTSDNKAVVKMINQGSQSNNTIMYLGLTDIHRTISYTLKNNRGTTPYQFNWGDRMQYCGYAIIDGIERISDTITKNQYGDEYISFTFDVARPIVHTYSTNQISAFSAVVHGEVTDDNNAIAQRGFCYDVTQNPTFNNSFVSVGEGIGEYSASLSDLQAGVTYYVRAYAMNEIGIAYGENIEFVTPDTLPEVITSPISDVTANSFVSGGNVLRANGSSVTARGICWGTDTNPSLEDEHTIDGDGVGNFVSTISELNCGTTYYVRAYATNEVGTSYGQCQSVTLPSGIPIVHTISAIAESDTSASVVTDVVSANCEELTERGACWSTSPNPTIADDYVSDSIGLGAITTYLTHLMPNTIYYVRAYATNNVGTSYGDEVSFTTSLLPIVITHFVSNLTAISAVSGGNVAFDGIAPVIARGVCWSTNSNPTIADSKTTDGSGTGNFTSSITGLSLSTTYYIRAYATNNVGTSYGDEVSFTTTNGIAAVTTNTISNITRNTATCGGNVTSDGGLTVTARGVCWSTNSNPTIADSKTTDGSGTGNFTSSITGLSLSTTYYVRAYATNANGTSYGEQRTFTTIMQDTIIAVNGASLTMKPVQGGTFYMGAQSTDSGGQNYDSEAYYPENPVHQVTVSSFYMGQYEVTQALWLAVMGSWPGTAPSSTTYGAGNNYPAYYVNWYDIQNFITQLNALTGCTFRLPTEAEWEFAARGGNQSHGYKYSGSNTIDDVAWYGGNSSYNSHLVGSKQANELGLYDMSGNVWEWCQDWYGSYESSAQTNPQGPSSGSYRVLRGGSWGYDAGYCRVSNRDYNTPGGRYNRGGFRLVLVQ